MMKTAVVIFSCNADRDNLWLSVLDSYAMQKRKLDSYLLVDSESTDSTSVIAGKYGWKILTEKRTSFNHGKTRRKVAEDLYSDGYEAVIFATQDVVLAGPDTLSILTDNLQETDAAVVYARQLPRDGRSFDGYFRLHNYPSVSRVKTAQDIPQLGLMTPFCSNSLAIWNLKKIHAAGGFPETDFGEDIQLGAKLILDGERISYCAESRCIHEHRFSWRRIFRRGVDIGRLYGRNPALMENFGKPEACAVRKVPIPDMLRYFFPLGVKYFGYLIGFNYEKIKRRRAR